MGWAWPVIGRSRQPVPQGDHPGAFGSVRKHDVHTGVDLYTDGDVYVSAVEAGMVVAIEPFTGPHAGSPWWNDTWVAMVEGASGVVAYGEIDPAVRVGQLVKAFSWIGIVRPVLKKAPRADIPGHSATMLHIELYRTGTRVPVDWPLGMPQPANLLDPTSLLVAACAGSSTRREGDPR